MVITADAETQAEANRVFGLTFEERGHNSTPITMFIAGAKWQASRPITDDQIAVMAQFISAAVRDSEEPGFDAFHTARVALETVRGAQ